MQKGIDLFRKNFHFYFDWKKGTMEVFFSIPRDIQILILSFLSPFQLGQLTLASKYFFTLGQENGLWFIYFGKYFGKGFIFYSLFSSELADSARIEFENNWKKAFISRLC